jgi:type IV pilus assembly protein PilE
MKTTRFKRSVGFTLIELMIVVVIVAILAAIAVPSYIKYVQHGRRSDAIAALTMDQGILERCYAQTFDYYNVTTAGNGCGTLTTANNLSPQKYYNVVLDTPAPASTSSGYVLVATPAPGSPQMSDALCTSFTLSSASGQQSTGSATPGTCWQQ